MKINLKRIIPMRCFYILIKENCFFFRKLLQRVNKIREATKILLKNVLVHSET